MDGGRAGRPAGPGRGPGQGADPCPADRIVPGQPGSAGAISGPRANACPGGTARPPQGARGPVNAHLPGGRRPPSLSIAPYVPGRPVQTARQDCGDRSPKLRKCVMKNVMTPNITLAIVLVAAMAAVALRATARRPEPRWASGAESAPIALRTPSSPGRPASAAEQMQDIFTSCTPMGAMLFARSATA